MVHDGDALHIDARQAHVNIRCGTIVSSILVDVNYQELRQNTETTLLPRLSATTRFAIVIFNIGHSQGIRNGALGV